MWVLFATLNPVGEALRGLFSKRASKHADPLLIAWCNAVIPACFFIPLLFILDLQLTKDFFIPLSISGSINITAFILYHNAISKEDISVVMPLTSFTPLFLLGTSPLIVGEFPTEFGLAGILFIVTGSYLLNARVAKGGIWQPLKSLITNKGTRYMLIVAFIWSISANFDKLAVEASSTWQYMLFLSLFVSTGLTIILLFKGKLKLSEFKKDPLNISLVGFISVFTFIFHMIALSLTLVAYVVALKRTSGMIGVLLGKIFLKEKHFRERLLGASLMFIGVLLIVLF